jgi:hypothetical protein
MTAFPRVFISQVQQEEKFDQLFVFPATTKNFRSTGFPFFKADAARFVEFAAPA